MTGVIYRIDYENNAEESWTALQGAVDGMDKQTELGHYLALLLWDGEIEIPPGPIIEEFEGFLSSLPGWDDQEAPEFAPHPLIIEAV